MRRKIVFLVLILSPLITFCQTPKKNLNKFWTYMERFNEDFVRIGSEMGESIPVAGRTPHWECDKNWHLNEYRCPKRKGKGMLFWGDSTIELGSYMSVLAMTIRNLMDAGQEYSKEAEELYYAIKAFERLDANAETFFGQEPKIDGLFIRDDVPEDFYMHDREDRFKQKDGTDFNCMISHGVCKLDDPIDGSMASMDQVMNLFLGFAFVVEMIPEVSHGDIVLADFAALQAHRITNFLIENKWKLVAPDGRVPPNKWGGSCMPFSHAIAKGTERLTKGKYRDKYSTGKSNFQGKIVLGTFNWAYGVQSNRNKWMAFAGVIISGKWNAKKMMRRAIKDERDMFGFAYCAINKKKLPKNADKKRIEEMLNSAPITGPCTGTPDCAEVPGWQGIGRWINVDSRNGDKWGNEREYNGLDYMLMYNLYHYFYKEILPPYRNPNIGVFE